MNSIKAIDNTNFSEKLQIIKVTKEVTTES